MSRVATWHPSFGRSASVNQQTLALYAPSIESGIRLGKEALDFRDHGSVLGGKPDGENTRRLFGIGRVVGPGLAEQVVVVDFQKNSSPATVKVPPKSCSLYGSLSELKPAKL